MLNRYLEDNFNKLKDAAYNIAGSNNCEDLLSFVIEELYKCDEKRIDEIILNKQLTFYIIRVMINQYHSKTSRYYYKYRKYYEIHTARLVESISPDRSIDEIDNKILLENRLDWIDKKLKECYWFDAECFRIYYTEQHSLNSMSKATGINRNTLHKAINNVKKFLIDEKD
jgi:DNA-directed RNA polymerase specialized sigma24 family protein